MAVRYATRRYPDLVAFVRDWDAALKASTIVLDAENLGGDPAPEVGIDLVLPDGRRYGPVTGQLIARLPGRGAAFRVADLPPEVVEAGRAATALVERIRTYLVESGQIEGSREEVTEEVNHAEARIAQLTATVERLQAQVQGLEAALANAGTKVEPTRFATVGPRVPTSLAAGTRGFPVPELAATPSVLGGTPDRLIAGLMTGLLERWTGVLHLRYGDGRSRLGYWSRGGVVAWRTDPLQVDEVLGVLLLRAEKITREELARSLEIMEERGCRQGEALVEMGVLTFSQVLLYQQRQAEFILRRVLSESNYEWSFHPLPELPERFQAPPVRVGAIAWRHLLSRYRDLSADARAELLAPALDAYLYLRPGLAQMAGEIGLRTEERRFLEIVSATSYRVREVASVSNLTRSATQTMLIALRELGFVELKGQEAAQRSRERLRGQVEHRREVAQKGTLFDRLGLHWLCTGREVEWAWRRVSGELEELRESCKGTELESEVGLVREAVDEAYQRLRGDNARRAYRLSLIERDIVVSGAELLAVKAANALMKGRPKDAWEAYAKAAELIPNSTIFQEGMRKAAAAGGAPE